MRESARRVQFAGLVQRRPVSPVRRRQRRGQRQLFYNRETGKAERAATQYEYPQGSACFIQIVDDTMEDIMRLATSEAMLFKYG